MFGNHWKHDVRTDGTHETVARGKSMPLDFLTVFATIVEVFLLLFITSIAIWVLIIFWDSALAAYDEVKRKRK